MDMDSTANLADAASDQLYPALFQCFAIIVCGYLAGRLNVVTQSESKGLATYVGTFALPSLIFLSLARVDFTTVNWTFLLAILLAKGSVFFAVVIVTALVSRPMNLGQAGIYAIFCTQSNDFALGYPIINAIYSKTHPEYALYLYLMAPISLAILNPCAFIMMEINKQRQLRMNSENRLEYNKFKIILQIFKGIVLNPILIMTVLGILGNIIFKHQLSVYIEGLLELFGQSFSASALFLLGLRMVGQIHRLRGPALIVPCVLIMIKLIVLPIIMRECVSGLHAGVNQTETSSLSTYAFLYGTIPTAPAVFVFSNLYQLEVDLMASSMVICTFLSAPITFLSAQVMSINEDYANQIYRFGFNLSIVALFAALWVTAVFVVTKKYNKMPHRITFSLNVTQVFLAISLIWGGPQPANRLLWYAMLQHAVFLFCSFSCLFWSSMLSIGLLMWESHDQDYMLQLWPLLALVGWGMPLVLVMALTSNNVAEGLPFHYDAIEAVRLSVLFFCLTVSVGCLIMYVRFRKQGVQSAPPVVAANGSTGPTRDETTALIDNAEAVSQTQSVSNQGCYGAITSTPSPSRTANNCCSNDPNCDIGPVNSNTQDIEDLGINTKIVRINDFPCAILARECVCPAEQRGGCGAAGACAGRAAGRGGQLFNHTALAIAHILMMFISIPYTTWKVMRKDEAGVFIEIQFLDTAATSGQALVMFVLFGLNADELVMPAFTYLKNKWYGTNSVVLPPVEELSFETKLVCEQFITHHLERCKKDIAQDIRYRMRTYPCSFRGACLCRWLQSCGLAPDAAAAAAYARRLLDGRVIAHVHNAHHFADSALVYTFL
ncbi:lysosomal cholesterol signaling protein isoform X2 [Epargyreus clarus]|uniref:lysosomal cholesterol signaling protein isoform X2 n=1 Tax=Epargyreus clarus TaxID=520877 RepID=UPI003C2F1D49